MRSSTARCDATCCASELYLPVSWTEDPDRCAKAGIPAECCEEGGFATKPELGVATLNRAAALGRNRTEILAVSHELELLDDELADLPRHREALSRFEAEGLDSRLAEQAE